MPAQFGSDRWWTRYARYFAATVEVLGFICTLYLMLLPLKKLGSYLPIKFANDHWWVVGIVGGVAMLPRPPLAIPANPLVKSVWKSSNDG